MKPAMLTVTEFAGFAGAGLAGAAYVPQISHLTRAHCSAGISRLAFGAWLLASLLTTARAIAIHAGVFIALGGIQIVATALIMLCATRYKDTPCPIHLPRQPVATTAAGTGIPGNKAGSCCPVGRSAAAESATPVERGGHCAPPSRTRILMRSRPGPAGNPDVQAVRTPPRTEIAAGCRCANGARPSKSRPDTEFQGRT